MVSLQADSAQWVMPNGNNCVSANSEKAREKTDSIGTALFFSQDLRLPAGNRLEALKGDRIGCYSVRVNEQYRITFQFKGGYADAVTCEDYH